MGFAWASVLWNNPAAKYGSMILLAFVGYKGWKMKVEHEAARSRERRIVREIEEETDEKIDRGEAARRAVERLNDGELHKLRTNHKNNRGVLR